MQCSRLAGGGATAREMRHVPSDDDAVITPQGTEEAALAAAEQYAESMLTYVA